MRDPGVLVGFIGLVVLASCHSVELPDAHWEIIVTNHQGELTLIDTTIRQLFADSRLVSKQHIETLSFCFGGWRDQETGVLATVEQDEAGAAIRVYDQSMKRIGEYRSPGGNSSTDNRLSAPVLSDGGGRLAFVNWSGHVVVGDVGGGAVAFREVCQLQDAMHAVPRIDCTWIGVDRLLVGFFDEIYLMNLPSGECRWQRAGKLLGARGQDAVVSQYDFGVGLIGLDGSVQKVLGKVGSRVPYAGHYIHRSSATGEYVAYDAASGGGKKLVIQHLASGRKAVLTQVGSVGSWNEAR